MAQFFVYSVLFIPFIVLMIWSYFYPEESLLLGNRWRYKEDPEFSNTQVSLVKFGSVIGIILITLMYINLFFVNVIINLVLFFVLLGYITFYLFKLRKRILEEDNHQ